MVRMVVVLCFVLYGSVSYARDPSTSHISKEPVKEAELQILKHGDIYSAGKVLGRIQILFKEQGIRSVRTAIPALNEMLSRLQKREGYDHSELEGELVAFLGKIGDASSFSSILNSVKTGTGSSFIGLVKYPSSVDSVTSYLQDDQLRVRGRAARCLVWMFRSAPELFTEARVSAIRDKLVENLGRHKHNSSDLFALAFFGNDSTIPILTEIANTDTVRLFNKYSNRVRAQYAIDLINQR